MSRFAQIDLSQLATPAIVEQLDFNTIKAAMVADLVSRDPSFRALLESDPAIKVIEACAYRELLLRQRINDAVKQCMLATATSTNLDHLAALVGVARLTETDADDNIVNETDARLRMRVQLAPESFSTCGPVGAYQFQAYSVSMDVADVTAIMTEPGTVRVTILATNAASTDGCGTPASSLLTSVAEALNADNVRPLTDVIEVRAPEIVHYSIQASITLYYGPDASTVRAAVEKSLAAYVKHTSRLGYNVTLAGLYAALQQSGVENSVITSPIADIDTDETQVAYCDSVTVSVAGRDE